MTEDERIEKIKYLREHLSSEAIFAQLAEECCELSQASLKYIRALGNGNPTPELPSHVMFNILEEAVDVKLCMRVAYIYLDDRDLDYKLDRWYKRVLHREEIEDAKKWKTGEE